VAFDTAYSEIVVCADMEVEVKEGSAVVLFFFPTQFLITYV
jgi:hypothetical protein